MLLGNLRLTTRTCIFFACLSFVCMYVCVCVCVFVHACVCVYKYHTYTHIRRVLEIYFATRTLDERSKDIFRSW